MCILCGHICHGMCNINLCVYRTSEAFNVQLAHHLRMNISNTQSLVASLVLWVHIMDLQ